ncbi:Na+/H+ antiporter NhaC family protein [Bacillus subtilis]|uniref:Na+/H+ antiporter NhaC-like C-terminal domain-containing protein n=1 Tax=Bacillus subtilis subsp. subtilis TaxID=135461 RepID=A0ABD3ZX61_BACIU|nr:Na+/H+ antiporter NhaC family protein [Bacillus subtilis]KIL32852.1 hypothetical protein B4067_4705 [Bacillus subtilis subsp. subtilis]KIN57461.1 hypothetical protein B4145_4593 [Bacillus subtilis]
MENKRISMYGGSLGGSIPLFIFIVGMISVTFAGTGGTKTYWAAGWIALLVGVFLAKNKSEYCQSIMRGLSNKNGVVVVTLWLFAGVFGKLMTEGGLIQGLLWIGLEANVQGAAFAVIALFCAMLFSLGTGTSTATVVALTPVLYPVGVFLGADPVVLAVAILAGAGFGDNFSPISDTTIVSASTQGADIKSVVRARMPLSLIAAVITIIIVFLTGGGGEVSDNQVTAEANPSGLIMLVSFVVLLTAVFLKRHMIEAFIWGILAATCLGILNGSFVLKAMFHMPEESGATSGFIEDGIASMSAPIIFVLIILAITQIMIESGAIEKILDFVTNKITKGARSAELAIIFVTAIVSTPISNNAAAALLVGPGFVKELGKKYKLSPSRRAIMMDCSVTSFYYTIPWHSSIVTWYGLLVVSANEWNIPLPGILSSFLNPYAWSLFTILIISAVFGWGRTFEKDTETESSSKSKSVS